MRLDFVPLGTSAAVATSDRHLPAAALVGEGAWWLFDCGEGTQFRLSEAGLRPKRLRAVCISHLHGDHFFGLFGLLSSLGMMRRERPLAVVGPAPIRQTVEAVLDASHTHLPYPLRFVELEAGFDQAEVLAEAGCTVTARPLDHRVRAVGYRFEEQERPGNLDVDAATRLGVTEHVHYRALKAGETVVLEGGEQVRPEQVVGPARPGRVFAYCFDTRPTPEAVRLATDADLLYHEATFVHALHEKAERSGHATAREAAEIAVAAGARRLLLGHFSSRYDTPAPLVEEARTVFPATEAAEEGKRYAIPQRPAGE